MNRPSDRSETKYYRIDAHHPNRPSMDELVKGITQAEEIAKEWEADGYEVEISNEY